MFYLIGLGLNVDSLTREAEKILKKCDKIYLENYTIDFPYDIKKLQEITGKTVELGRDKVESEEIVVEARDKDVALLVYGSPLIATTHISLILRAEKEKIPVKIIHNASIFDSISETGLQSYKFGKIASMPAWKDKGKTSSFVKIIKDNQGINAHTLILVDIGLKLKEAIEQLEEALREEKMEKLLDEEIQEILILAVLILTFPLGYLLAYLCKDELVQLRRWFKGIIIVCFISIFIFLLLIQNVIIVFTLIFIAIISLINLRMSYNKKFLGKYAK